jgi:hypothetical protein
LDYDPVFELIILHRTFLKAKLHRVTTTASEVDYEGSCEIDGILLEAAGIHAFEQIQIYNISNINFAINNPHAVPIAKATIPSTKIPSVSGCKNLSAINFEPTAKPKKIVTILIKATISY